MLITRALLDEVSRAAATTPRRRQNRNLHRADDARSHRLLNAVEPDSYVRPHRHLDPAKDESIVALRGRFGVILFDDDGAVASCAVIAPDSECLGIDIPHGRFHTIVALLPGSVFFEAKAGPYVPLAADEWAAWSAAEGTPAAAEALTRYRALFD